jgi:excisionase family DNA binding protein
LLDARAAARLLAVNRQRLYALVRNKILPPGVYVRLGAQIRFDRAALRAWLHSGGAGLSKNSGSVQ